MLATSVSHAYKAFSCSLGKMDVSPGLWKHNLSTEKKKKKEKIYNVGFLFFKWIFFI